MSDYRIVLRNVNSGLYEPGVPFSPTKWYTVHEFYEREMQNHGLCSERRLASVAGISRKSAKKAIHSFYCGSIIPFAASRGHGYKGVGTLIGLLPSHHSYMYDLYLDNLARPLDGYVEELEVRFGLVVNCEMIRQWFETVGNFPGKLRKTSTYNSGRNDARTIGLLSRYLTFMSRVTDHQRLVFADEKPMKGKDIYGRMRRNIMTGDTPGHTMTFSNANRFNILAAVSVKGGHVRAVEYILLEKVRTDTPIFLRFVKRLLRVGTLERGDIFVVDNCSVHIQGDNSGLQESLMSDFGILMLALPPYHPELNPTELVFNTLLMRLRSARARYKAVNLMNFGELIKMVLNNITMQDVSAFYNFCGYYINN